MKSVRSHRNAIHVASLGSTLDDHTQLTILGLCIATGDSDPAIREDAIAGLHRLRREVSREVMFHRRHAKPILVSQ